MKKLEINIGERFNMLTILEELPVGSNGRVFSCLCDCGNIKQVLLPHLIRSLIMSCGCHRIKMATKHGMYQSREYSTWENMVQRCTNPNARKYYLYGGRGITICDRWLKSFKAFYEDMGPRPDNTTLDRKENDLGYYKENCKWSNPREQLVNVRFFATLVKHDDIVKTTEEWISDLNIDRELFKSRVLKGLTFREALFCEMDIITLNVINKQQVIYHLSQFLADTKFDKEIILGLLDNNHEEPYSSYIIRYLSSFTKWPDKCQSIISTDTVE